MNCSCTIYCSLHSIIHAFTGRFHRLLLTSALPPTSCISKHWPSPPLSSKPLSLTPTPATPAVCRQVQTAIRTPLIVANGLPAISASRSCSPFFSCTWSEQTPRYYGITIFKTFSPSRSYMTGTKSYRAGYCCYYSKTLSLSNNWGIRLRFLNAWVY